MMSSSKQPLLDDVGMIEALLNDREDENIFMKFFQRFEGLSMKATAACKEVCTSGSKHIDSVIRRRLTYCSLKFIGLPVHHTGFKL